MTNNITINMGKALKQLQIKYNTSNLDLQNYLGVSHPTIVKLRSDEHWKTDRLQSLAAYFGITPVEFVGYAQSEVK